MAHRGFQRRLLALFSLQPGQGVRTALASLYLFLIIATYFLLKPVRDSLFLDTFGAVKLPYVTIGYALGVGIFVAFYTRLARRIRPVMLVTGTLLFFVSNVLVFRWLTDRQIGWLYPVLYIWVGMFGSIAPAQVWTLANDLFTTREAKRVFGVLGGGGILGSICGGELVSFLAPRIGTINILFAAAFALLLACVVVQLLWRYRLPTASRKDEAPPPRSLRDSLQLIAQAPHLRLVASLVFMTALATTMIDFQFKAVAADSLSGDALSSFFGKFYSRVNVLGFLLQILLTSRLLRFFGLGGTILMLPLFLSGGTVLLMSTMTLWAAVVLKGSDQTLKHSIDRSSRELVYLPVSRSIKIHVKSAIDMVFDRLGDGIAGVILLVLVTFASLGVLHVAAINLAFLVICLVLAMRLRRSYVAELNRSIAEGRIEVGTWHEAIAGADTLATIEQSLRSGHEPTVLAALDLVADNPQWELTEVLCDLAKGGTPEVRARALAILLDPENPELPQGVTEAFQQEDQDLLAECIDLRLAATPEERQQRADAILARAGGPARGAWVALMVRRLGPEFRPVARGLLKQLVSAESTAATREVAATAIGLIPAETGMADLLPPLLQDSDAEVASAAVRSAAAIGGEPLLRSLVPMLGHVSTRKAARSALQARGDEAVTVLLDSSADASLERRSRLKIPSVLAGIQSADCLTALTHLLVSEDPGMAQAASEALYKIRMKKPDLALLPERDAKGMILSQATDCALLLDQLTALEARAPEVRGPAWDLLLASLRASYQHHHAAIFRLLCLCYSPRHIMTCRRSLLDQNLELRANAAELLDNLVPRRLWQQLLPILYPEEFGAGAKDRPEDELEPTLLQLVNGEAENWTRACALNLIGELRLTNAREATQQARSHADPHVREAAERALARLDGGATTLKVMTVVEKVMALRSVELFREIPPAQLALVAAIAREETFPASHVLGRQDDPPGDLYVLLGGRVAIERDGRPVGVLAQGDALGTWALFEDEPLQVTATAAEETPALRIDRWGFEEVLEEHPEMSRALIQQLIKQLRKLAQ